VIVEGERAVLGVSLGRFTVANEKFDGSLCGSGCAGGVRGWGGEKGRPRHWVLRGGERALSRRGSFGVLCPH